MDRTTASTRAGNAHALALSLGLAALALASGTARAGIDAYALSAGGRGVSSAAVSGVAVVGDVVSGRLTAAPAAGDVGFVRSLDFTGPTIALASASGTAGAPVTVNATIVDDVAVTSATLFHRTGGQGPFAPSTMTASGGNTWSATIPAGSVDVRGVQYYVVASDGFTVVTAPAGAPGLVTASLPVTVTDHTAFALPAGQHVMLGVPLAPASATPTAVFDELGAYDDTRWRYGTYDPALGGYREPPAAAAAQPGQGFWVIAKDAASIRVSGTSTDLSQPFPIVLEPGFNQVANPFAFAVDTGNVVFPDEVDRNLIGYAGGGYQPLRPRLEVGSGYFIYNGAATDRTLLVKPLGPGVGPAPAAAARAGAGETWSATLRVAAGDRFDGGNRIGFRDGAGAARDAGDLMHAPPPPGGYVSLVLVGAQGERLMSDWRGLEAGGARWTARVEGGPEDLPFTVMCDFAGGLPDGWGVVAFESGSGAETDLLASPRLSGHLRSPASTRTWTVVAGPAGTIESERRLACAALTRFTLGPVRPNPLRRGEGMALELAVPERAEAVARLYDVSGRVVRTLIEGTLERGIHRLAWDGGDQAGRPRSPGVYFLRVSAGDFVAMRRVLLLD